MASEVLSLGPYIGRVQDTASPPPHGRVHWSVGRVSPAAAQPGSVGPVGPASTEVVALILGRTLSSRYSSVY